MVTNREEKKHQWARIKKTNQRNMQNGEFVQYHDAGIDKKLHTQKQKANHNRFSEDDINFP